MNPRVIYSDATSVANWIHPHHSQPILPDDSTQREASLLFNDYHSSADNIFVPTRQLLDDCTDSIGSYNYHSSRRGNSEGQPFGEVQNTQPTSDILSIFKTAIVKNCEIHPFLNLYVCLFFLQHFIHSWHDP